MYLRLLVLVLLLTGCTAQQDKPAPATTTTTTTTDSAEPRPKRREARVAGGLALSYVQAETAAQMLCRPIMPDYQLNEAFGVKRLSYHPVAKLTIIPHCEVVDYDYGKTFEMTLEFPDPKLAARTETVKGDRVVVTTPIAQFLPTSARVQRPVLSATARPGQKEFMLRYLEHLVVQLSKQTDELPPIGPDGSFPFTETPLTPETIIDLPKPVQALQLCTLVRKEFGFEPVKVLDRAACTVREPDGGSLTITLQTHTIDMRPYTSRVGGRPAMVDPGGMWHVRLRDDVPLDLVMPPGHVNVMERLVKALTQK
ncbi:hypothetical protein [Kibdelosporangium phytohabitans]|uniref:DUF3558 domain-containing protein n=1 Tax=Kibdelosporangium phytohabitans TaxID=860235 RepID=A0A0N9HZ58_9PSEU|nr:hypothetical protein [Kibdelosporangium phytohabitans]ALG12600.1 hypothetical protein AOZ06_42230 [Kibdelosporangium phytohabitans]MBE1464233.1 hypothetical protein [Kibdelosporangium phytohabitans]